jgi:hypothetical protein
MVGRFAAVTGPLVWAGSTWFTNHLLHLDPLRSQGIAVLVLLLLMFLSYWILQPVSDEKRNWNQAQS